MTRIRTWTNRTTGFAAALSSAFFMGISPTLGKTAFSGGFLPVEVVGLRALGAALLLFLIIFFWKKNLLQIYPMGLIGCLLAGWINALGALFYYSAITRIDTSLGAIIYSLYPGFVALFLLLDGYAPSRLSVVRLAIAIPAIVLITSTGDHRVDLVGILLMLASSALYALHLPVNQRVLYEVPAPTVTFYTLVASAAVLLPMLLFNSSFTQPHSQLSWLALGGMTLAIFLSRLTLFAGVKHIGGLQTALLGLGELLVTVFFGIFLLKEELSPTQWLGGFLMAVSILLGVREPPVPTRLAPGTGWLAWLHPKSPEELVREALAAGALAPLPPANSPPEEPPSSPPSSDSTAPQS
ncbi:MAG: DMT family transporter [Anaerolineales bacterium]|nr:DMT family transporter [Anaerolineales bacterium]